MSPLSGVLIGLFVMVMSLAAVSAAVVTAQQAPGAASTAGNAAGVKAEAKAAAKAAPTKFSAKFVSFSTWTSLKSEKVQPPINVDFPKFAKSTLLIDSESSHFNLQFTIESDKAPSYISLILINKESGLSVVLAPKRSRSKENEYVLKMKYTHPAFNQGVPGNGDYTMRVAMADEMMEKRFTEWNVCDVKIDLHPRSPGAVRLSYLRNRAALPETEHKSRKDSARPHVLLSLIFTVMSVLPLIGLVSAWKSLPLNMAMPDTSSFIFHVVLAAILLLFVMYWIGGTLIGTARWLVVLGTIAIFTGHRALKLHAMQEIEQKAIQKMD